MNKKDIKITTLEDMPGIYCHSNGDNTGSPVYIKGIINDAENEKVIWPRATTNAFIEAAKKSAESARDYVTGGWPGVFFPFLCSSETEFSSPPDGSIVCFITQSTKDLDVWDLVAFGSDITNDSTTTSSSSIIPMGVSLVDIKNNGIDGDILYDYAHNNILDWNLHSVFFLVEKIPNTNYFYLKKIEQEYGDFTPCKETYLTSSEVNFSGGGQIKTRGTKYCCPREIVKNSFSSSKLTYFTCATPNSVWESEMLKNTFGPLQEEYWPTAIIGYDELQSKKYGWTVTTYGVYQYNSEVPFGTTDRIIIPLIWSPEAFNEERKEFFSIVKEDKEPIIFFNSNGGRFEYSEALNQDSEEIVWMRAKWGYTPGLNVLFPIKQDLDFLVTRDGHYFKGWSLERDTMVPLKHDTLFTKDTTIYAIWEPISEEN